MHRLALLLVASTLISALSGCAGYRAGAKTLYRPDIQTVHVPVFESESLRRHLGEWLTEAVVKEIESETPYKVVGPTSPDSVLTGRIVSLQKRVLGESPNDDPRNLEATLRVQLTWTDRLGNIIMQREISQPANFIPEGGQSIATAEQESIRNIAHDVVTQMQIWW